MRLLLVAALTGALAYNYWGPKPLDGTVWEVSIRRSIVSFPRKDTLVFDGGRLTVTGAVAQGRSSTRYSAKPAKDGTLWTAELSGVKGESMSWQGVCRGDRLEGTVLVADQAGRTRRLTFSGFRRPGA